MRRTMWLLLVACGLLGLLGVLAAGCGDTGTSTTSAAVSTTTAENSSTTIFAPTEMPPPSGEPVAGGVAKVASLQAPAKFGFPATVIGPDQWFEGLFLETMFNPTAKVDEYVPALAESWDLTADKSAYVFHLRQGVKFTDGTDFNAEACKFCWDMMIPVEGGPAARCHHYHGGRSAGRRSAWSAPGRRSAPGFRLCEIDRSGGRLYGPGQPEVLEQPGTAFHREEVLGRVLAHRIPADGAGQTGDEPGGDWSVETEVVHAQPVHDPRKESRLLGH